MKRFLKKILVVLVMSVTSICTIALGAHAFSSSTHEYTTLRGITIFKENYPNLFDSLYDKDFEPQLKIFCTRPDDDENEGTFKYHFYNPATEKNFNGEDESALTRFKNHYNKAVKLYKEGKKFESYEFLARSLHFLEDMNTPVHTNNQSFLDSAFDSLFHMSFEKKCVNLQNLSVANLSPREFDYYKNNEIEQIGKASAILANDNFYAMYKKISSKENVALKSVENAQKAVAGVIYKFSVDVNN